MNEHNKPGHPKDKEDTEHKSNPNQAPKNPQDRQNQGGADKSRQDSGKTNNPTHTKE